MKLSRDVLKGIAVDFVMTHCCWAKYKRNCVTALTGLVLQGKHCVEMFLSARDRQFLLSPMSNTLAKYSITLSGLERSSSKRISVRKRFYAMIPSNKFPFIPQLQQSHVFWFPKQFINVPIPSVVSGHKAFILRIERHLQRRSGHGNGNPPRL